MNSGSPGILYICATPIGNMEDITLRVLRILKEVDLIAAEDTRHTGKLLHYYEIETPMISYHENNKGIRDGDLVNRLKNGANIALVSDSGMPIISDPGRELIEACIKEGLEVRVCPGASAGLAGLVLSGFTARPHVFEGFLPRDNAARKKVLKSLQNEMRTMVFYEAPHRLLSTLGELESALGGQRQMAASREITKKFEETLHGSISELIEIFKAKPPKGEFVLVVKGADTVVWKYPENIMFHVEHYIAQGYDEKDAIKQAAKDRGVAKNIIYNEIKRK